MAVEAHAGDHIYMHAWKYYTKWLLNCDRVLVTYHSLVLDF